MFGFVVRRGSLLASLFVILGGVAAAATPPPATPPPASPAPAAAAVRTVTVPGPAATNAPTPPKPYDAFVKGAEVTPGLIPLVHKDGALYFVLSKANLGRDLIETSVPSTGLGGLGPAAGEPYVAPARIMRFERFEDRIVIRWPNTIAEVTANTPEASAALQSFPSSVIAVETIAAENAANGDVVISAAPFLGDVADYAATFADTIKNPLQKYHLDPLRTYFSQAKAFEQNDVLRVAQTWTANEAGMVENAPDARSIEVSIAYNIIAAPSDGYMPRLADPRVGYFSQPLLDFTSDLASTRNVDYLTRWNFAPKTPGAPSDASHPLVFVISNDVPEQYRPTISAALLTWNDALARVGIRNAITVQQQPSDSSFDPDDLSHNMVRWVDTTQPQYGAEALIINDPRTGEEMNVGINVDAVEGTSRQAYRFVVAPARGLRDTPAAEAAFTLELLRSTVLHESGHDLGLQHNFIGSMAYSAKDLQSKAFTDKYGVATSVMEYAPINLWPRGTPQGDYAQTVLGPYDYYAVRYGYEYIPGATTPQAEGPTLDKLASKWTDPTYRFASDEDVSFGNGHAVDPRVAQDDLTEHPLRWCDGQMSMMHRLMNTVDLRFPKRGQPWDEARRAFMLPLRYYGRCALLATHTIGGEYLSRAEPGDPGAKTPLQAVSRQTEYRAWQQLATGLFSDAAWRFNPSVLDRLTYSEVSSLSSGTWSYAPTPQHGVPVVQIAGRYQDQALEELFAPLTLERIDTLATRYSPGATMTLGDLFDWSDQTIFGDITGKSVASTGVVRRNLQMRFARRLALMWTAPAAGTPPDAQAMARLELTDLKHASTLALARPHLDALTRARLAALVAVASQALDAHATLAMPSAAPQEP